MKPLPWSHSALSDFNNCPKAYYHKRIAKDVEDPPNEAGLWGDYVHKEFEKYLNQANQPAYTAPLPLPDELDRYRAYLDSLAGMRGEMFVECKYAITRQQEPCDFFAPDVWCRAILDVIVIDGERAFVLDHKTGKRKPNSRQLKLSALMVFIHHPSVQIVKTAYYWLKEDAYDAETYVRADYLKLWEEFLPDLKQYLRAAKEETWTPRPSGLCYGWCPVQQCEFWKPKRGR